MRLYLHLPLSVLVMSEFCFLCFGVHVSRFDCFTLQDASHYIFMAIISVLQLQILVPTPFKNDLGSLLYQMTKKQCFFLPFWWDTLTSWAPALRGYVGTVAMALVFMFVQVVIPVGPLYKKLCRDHSLLKTKRTNSFLFHLGHDDPTGQLHCRGLWVGSG